jgi:hypothetical protein
MPLGHILNTRLDRGQWSDSCTRHFTPGEIDPRMHWIGGWMGIRASLKNRKIVKSKKY